jgi:hypothetical protein
MAYEEGTQDAAAQLADYNSLSTQKTKVQQ